MTVTVALADGSRQTNAAEANNPTTNAVVFMF